MCTVNISNSGVNQTVPASDFAAEKEKSWQAKFAAQTVKMLRVSYAGTDTGTDCVDVWTKEKKN